MKPKKVLALLLCLTVAFAFASCGKEEEPSMAETNKTEIKEEQAANKDNKNYGKLSQQALDAGVADEDSTAIAGVGETLSNDFFDWTINSYKTAKKTHGVSAGEGYKFVIINMTMTNTETEAYPTGNYEFRGVVYGAQEDLDSENAFYDGMIADEFEFGAGETVTGDVVFKVPEDTDSLIVNYLEVYADESQGNMYWYELAL